MGGDELDGVDVAEGGGGWVGGFDEAEVEGAVAAVEISCVWGVGGVEYACVDFLEGRAL